MGRGSCSGEEPYISLLVACNNNAMHTFIQAFSTSLKNGWYKYLPDPTLETQSE